MPLRVHLDDNGALLGAYGNWLQYMADGAYTSGSAQMVFPPGSVARANWELTPYRHRSCGAFLAEAKHRGWVENIDRDYYISERGREALDEYKAWRP